MKTIWKLKRIAVVGVVAILSAGTASAVDIAPPKAQVVDRFGVNMTNGQVSQSLDTVSIGGAMGLSHSISVDANEFNYSGYYGFRDKFFGQARNETISTDPYFSPQNVLRVFDFTDTVEFEYWVGGVRQNSGWGLTSGYSYKSHGDERHTLTYDANFLYWTKPDGTVVRFSRGVGDAATSALLTDITYPNGFRIDVWYAGMSVNTNTGFQLKALYPPDNRALDKTDKPYLQNAPPANSASWAIANPKYIKGINNVVEYCLATATDCALNGTWPTATFNWPAGMPRTMFLGDTNVSVIDSLGRTTTFSYRAYDQAYEVLQGGVVAQGQTLDRKYSPRLIGVTTTGTPRQLTYDYRNVWTTLGGFLGTWDEQLQTSGVVVSATRLGASTSYDALGRYYDDLLSQNYGSGANGVSKVQVRAHSPEAIGALYYAETEEGRFDYENSARNFPTSFVPSFGPRQDFTYERGNLKRITYQSQVPAQTTYVEATYPADCISTPRNRCNQATSIRDARGNYTYYTYHPDSGQVESIRRPADVHGVYPETHYEYQQLATHHYSVANGEWIFDLPGVWMKTAERYCINSNYSSRLPTATCASGDEVVTRYEYNNNLLLKSVVVTSADGTLRTCYQYDKYGNQMGKIEPNANLSSCN